MFAVLAGDVRVQTIDGRRPLLGQPVTVAPVARMNFKSIGRRGKVVGVARWRLLARDSVAVHGVVQVDVVALHQPSYAEDAPGEPPTFLDRAEAD